MDSSTALDRVDSGVTRILDALGAAWVTYLLYPNPKDQVPFQRAVEILNQHSRGEAVGVGPGLFVIAGEHYEARREGVEKLARRLFLHDVEELIMRGGATVDGLDALFTVVAEDDVVVRDQGGILAMLRDAAPSGIAVRQRGLLNIGPTDGEGGAALRTVEEPIDGLDLPELARIAFSGAGPGEIAAAAAERESADAVDAFIDAYRELHGRITDADADPNASILHGLRLPTDDPYKTVRAYIEAFFHLPRWMQVDVLERVLSETDRADHQMFLDQFSGHDLADLLPDLSDKSSDRLLGYAVDASAEGAGAHPLDLLAGLSSSAEVEAARLAVAERVSAMLASGGETVEALAALRAEMEDEIDDPELEATTLRGLFECEDRRDRFQRVTRVWTARIARYIRAGDLEHAADLLSVIQEEERYPEDNADLVRKSLERLTTPDLLRSLAAEQVGDEASAARRLLSGLGRQVIDELVIQLASEEEKAVRRQLTELLAAAAASRPSAIEPYLKDQRWYVVRNLVTALGRTGNPNAARSVRLVAGHTDHRVRIEALRSLVTLLRDDAAPVVVKALSDEDERVRQAAVTLLKGRALTDVDRQLVAELRDDQLAMDAALGVIAILGSRAMPEGRAALEDLAAKRFAFKGRTRTLRAAARKALEEEA
jgi:HEAT repeats